MAGTAPESGRPALRSVPERGTGAVDTVGAGGFNSFRSREAVWCRSWAATLGWSPEDGTTASRQLENVNSRARAREASRVRHRVREIRSVQRSERRTPLQPP
jgi:hypothetical protein